ncbi:MAG: NUDIX hydrolase [Promicromonosporaceae bacterium]|nr:NUDIX hydrolase [Promicromonosporaceae bacterium]
MTWQTRSSKVAYQNRWIRVREDQVVRPDGSDGLYGVVEVGPSVFVVALDDDDRVLLVDVDRYTVGRSLEVVAGGSDGEDLLAAAQRELLEEAGLVAERWEQAGSMFALNGVCVAPETVFIARKLSSNVDASILNATQNADGITGARWVPFGETLVMIARREITDGETIASLAIAGIHLGRFR